MSYQEKTTGFNCLAMCCHLVNEKDSLNLIKILHDHNQDCKEAHKVDINTKDVNGNTLLHQASVAKKLSVCEYLIDYEADVTTKNKDNMLAIDLAQTKEVKQYLFDFQKPQNLKKLKPPKEIP